jgi:hypothetical protein
LKKGQILTDLQRKTLNPTTRISSIFSRFLRFFEDMVSNQENCNSSLKFRVIVNIFFCFEALNQRKLFINQFF